MALSANSFSKQQFEEGYTLIANKNTISSLTDLEKYYMSKGGNEMFVRIATEKKSLEEALTFCKIAKELNVPLNPELMCAHHYMDVETQEAPNFEEYEEIYALQNGKSYEELSLEEINVVLKAYGKYAAKTILETGCTVINWNLSNEANFGFAGVSIGLKTKVNPILETISYEKYIYMQNNPDWFVDNLWKYNGKNLAAMQDGIIEAYEELNINHDNVKFSTHISTVLATPVASFKYFETLKNNGYNIDVAGLSFYPSAPGLYADSMDNFKETVEKIVKENNLPVFIAEFAYPSGEMSGAYEGWNKKCKDYEHSEEGQAKIINDVLSWGKSNGVNGLCY